MVTTVGNLSEKGIAFYPDETMTNEIPQNAIMDIARNGELEFYMGIRHRVDSSGRMGKILSLEENYKIFMLDMVQEVDGESFRNYDNIDSISVETEFDAYGMIRNTLLENKTNELYKILTLIGMNSIWGRTRIKEAMERKMMEPERIRFAQENSPKDSTYGVPPPKGFWSDGGWPIPEYYSFLTDFFIDPNERSRVPMWTQFIQSKYIRSGYTHEFLESGFSGLEKNYNYTNNIYPEHTALLDYRWKNGGFDITPEEFRSVAPEIFERFSSWYLGKKSYLGGTSSLTPFKADGRTVAGFTGIGKTEYYDVFKRDEYILTGLLGPRHCVGQSDSGCQMYGYGDDWDASEEDKNSLLFNLNNPSGIQIDRVASENIFFVMRADQFSQMSDSVIQSELSRQRIADSGSPDTIEAMFSIRQNFGKMGGQTIYSKGEGNEHRYFMPFNSFLDEQGWTIDDFMEVYKTEIDACIGNLRESVSSDEIARVKDYSEFYDSDRKAPFDGIQHYIPIPITMKEGGSTFVKIEKKRVEVDQDGNETIFNVPKTILPATSSFRLEMDKNEFVDSVSVEACSILVSTFMKTKIRLKFNDQFPTLDKVKIRVFTSDFTFMNEREFKVK